MKKSDQGTLSEMSGEKRYVTLLGCCMNYAVITVGQIYHAYGMKACRGLEFQLHTFLTSALDDVSGQPYVPYTYRPGESAVG